MEIYKFIGDALSIAKKKMKKQEEEMNKISWDRAYYSNYELMIHVNYSRLAERVQVLESLLESALVN